MTQLVPSGEGCAGIEGSAIKTYQPINGVTVALEHLVGYYCPTPRKGKISAIADNQQETDAHNCKNLLPMDAITQYIYATRNAFISGTIRFVAQTFVCATDSIEHAVEALLIKMAAGDTTTRSTSNALGGG